MWSQRNEFEEALSGREGELGTLVVTMHKVSFHLTTALPHSASMRALCNDEMNIHAQRQLNCKELLMTARGEAMTLW